MAFTREKRSLKQNYVTTPINTHFGIKVDAEYVWLSSVSYLGAMFAMGCSTGGWSSSGSNRFRLGAERRLHAPLMPRAHPATGGSLKSAIAVRHAFLRLPQLVLTRLAHFVRACTYSVRCRPYTVYARGTDASLASQIRQVHRRRVHVNAHGSFTNFFLPYKATHAENPISCRFER